MVTSMPNVDLASFSLFFLECFCCYVDLTLASRCLLCSMFSPSLKAAEIVSVALVNFGVYEITKHSQMPKICSAWGASERCAEIGRIIHAALSVWQQEVWLSYRADLGRQEPTVEHQFCFVNGCTALSHSYA